MDVSRIVRRIAVAIAVLVVALPTAPGNVAAHGVRTARALPDRLSDADFWKLTTQLSDSEGPFRIVDNFTSNEPEIGRTFTALRDAHVQGDVYMGVGPEQNFTYIAAVRPRMAFIVDIRRQAWVHHLLFKMIFEMAKDRADFISLTFGIPRPAGFDTVTSIQKIWEPFLTASADTALQAKNYARIVERLTKTHGFTFSPYEMDKLKRVFDAFQFYGPGITTQSGSNNGRGGGGFGGGATFADLTGWSLDGTGQPKSFLSSEENYQYVKSLQEKNLVVPVTGDFGLPKAIRAVGSYLKEHGGIVRAFYVSNVEQYLFQDYKQNVWFDNVATLPVDSASVFIRPTSMGRGGVGMVVQLCPIAAFEKAAAAGTVTSYNAARACAR